MLRSLTKTSLPRLAASRGVRFSSSVDLFNPTDDHAGLREMVSRFSKEKIAPQAHQFNKEERLNMDLFRECGQLGLLGVTADPHHGGSGMDAVSTCIVMEEMCRYDPGFGLSYLAHTLLFVNNLNWNANEEQKARFLPDVCSGAKIGGMGMSEANAGTDVLGMKTNAVKQGDQWILNGSKMWITNGAVNDKETGDVFLIYAKTEKGLTLFIVEKGMEGFSLGTQIKDKLGMRASTTGELSFTDVVIPEANLVGTEGKAVWCMMRNLEIERLALGAMSTGIGLECMDIMKKYAVDRKAFGSSLTHFGQIQRFIGEGHAKLMAARCYLYNIAGRMSLDKASQRVETDGVKLFAAMVGKEIADNAIQTLGGNGYVGEYNVERLWRDAKLLEIGGGTMESHHKNMTRDLTRVE